MAPGYGAAVDLLTRHDEESDFARDTCVYKEGVDPETGTRYLEEIAFEVVSEQNEEYVSEKAGGMHRRGVRRIFAVFVKSPRVCEWSPENQSWRLLDPDSWIEDPCLVAPLSVAALLDAALADDAVVRALAAKGNPEIQRREAAAEAARYCRVHPQVLGRARFREPGATAGDLELSRCRSLGPLASPGRRGQFRRRSHLRALRRTPTAPATPPTSSFNPGGV